MAGFGSHSQHDRNHPMLERVLYDRMNEDADIVDYDEEMIVAKAYKLPLPLPNGGKQNIYFHSAPGGISEVVITSGCDITVCLEADGSILRRYSLDFIIQKVIWVKFRYSEDTNTEEFMCVVGEEQLMFYSVRDHHPYSYSVPFKMRGAYATNMGLLVERQWQDSDLFVRPDDYSMDIETDNTQTTSNSNNQVSCLENEVVFVKVAPAMSSTMRLKYIIMAPVGARRLVSVGGANHSSNHQYLYSISHPLSEMLPVIYKPKDTLTQWRFCWQHESIKIVDGLGDCLLVYDVDAQVHRIYRVRATSEEELRTTFRISERVRELHSTPITTVPLGFESPMQSGVPLARSVHTRSMTAHLTRTQTFPREAKNFLPPDSPAVSTIYSPAVSLGDSLGADSPFRLNYFSTPLSFLRLSPNVSMKLAGLQRQLIRDPDLDLLLAEVCLECIWTEPIRRDPKGHIASYAFLSNNLLGQEFLSFFVQEQEQLRTVRLTKTKGVVTVSTTGQALVTSCKDACPLQRDSGHMICETDGRLTLYSANMKVASVTAPLLPNASCSIKSGIGTSFAVLSKEEAWIVVLPEYNLSLVEEMFSLLFSLLPQERAHRMAADWRCTQSWRALSTDRINNVAHEAFEFLMLQSGFVLKEDTEDDAGCDGVAAKQMRPRNTDEQNWSCVLELLNIRDDAAQPVLRYDWKNVDANLYQHVFIVMGVVHSTWEGWLLDAGMHSTRKHLAPLLTEMAWHLHLPVYVKMYNQEYPEIVYPNIPSVSSDYDDLSLAASRSGVFSAEHPISILTSIRRFLNKDFFIPIKTSSYRILRFLLDMSVKVFSAVAAGVGSAFSLIEVQRMIGKNWVKKARLSSKQADNVIEVISDRSTSAPFKSMMSWEEVVAVSRTRWPFDIRLENVIAMLDSSRPVLISPTHLIIQHGTDVDVREAQESFLQATCIRYLTQAFGRAMVNFRTDMPRPTENLQIPELCLSGRVYPLNLSFELTNSDTRESFLPFREWGEFYNGVAAALRLCSFEDVTLDQEWLLLQCSQNESRSAVTAAGALYGFGLNGHVANMNMFHIHELLTALDRFQSIALLLGFSLSRCGSADVQVFKVLTTHLPFMMGPTLLDIKVDSLIQTAAVASLGILFAETANEAIVNKLINEIGKSPAADEEPSPDRTAYKLNAGFAVGLICLGMGEKVMKLTPFSEPQPSITDRLVTLMNGGQKKRCVVPQQTSNSQMSDFLHTSQVVNASSSHMKELLNANVHLTGHPATIALGLMFLKTGNKGVANSLKLPETIMSIEAVRPDLLMIRTISRYLILWDQIVPDEEWIIQQVPSVVMEYMRASMKWGGDQEDRVSEEEDTFWDEVVDRETLAQTFVYVVTGICFVVALKYMGDDVETRRTAIEVIKTFVFIFQPDNRTRAHQRIRQFAGPNVISLCFNTLLQCMGMLCSGNGELDVMVITRMWRMHEQLFSWIRHTRKHHEQMSCHQTLGMLFMGKGRLAFKTDNLSLAMLVIAFYPITCHNITDNRLYHQPLRLLWTQAVEPRLLVPVRGSSESGKKPRPVSCTLRLYLKNDKCVSLQAPCILPALEKIRSIEIGGGGLEMVRFDLSIEKKRTELQTILKSKKGYLPMHSDEQTRPLNTDHLVPPENDISYEALLNGDFSSVRNESSTTTKKRSEDLAASTSDSVPLIKHHLTTLLKIVENDDSFAENRQSSRLAPAVCEHIGDSEMCWVLEEMIEEAESRRSIRSRELNVT